MKKRISPLVAACFVLASPTIHNLNAYAQSVQAYNPDEPVAGQLGLSRNVTLGELGVHQEDGGFKITNPEIIRQLGYDPSRIWRKGDPLIDGIQVGDVDGVFKIKDLTPRQIAEITGTNVNALPLVDLYGEQTLKDLIKLNPDIANAPVESIPAIRDLIQGNYSSAIQSGISISEYYSKDVAKFLEARPELRDLPIRSILSGDFKGALPVAQQTAFRELQAKLPEQFKDLPIKSLPALTALRKGNIGSAVESGFKISVDHFDALQKFIDKNPALKNVPIADVINRDWGSLATHAEKLAFKKLANVIPPSAQGFTGKSIGILKAARKGDLNSLYEISGSSIKGFNKILENNPHLKDLPLNQILRGDVQAALPKAQQVAIYEISKKLPTQYRGLPGQALGALTDLSQGNLGGSIEKGLKISSEHFGAIKKLYEKYPELEGVSVAEVLQGDFDSLVGVGEKVALKQLSKIDARLGDLPIGAIVRGDIKAVANQGIKIGAREAIGHVLKNNPALGEVALGALDNPAYSIGSVEGLADTSLGAIKAIDGKLISKIPGLKNIPLDVVNANNISALLKGDLFGTLDIPFGEKEMLTRNALSGFTRGKKFTPKNCNAEANDKTEHCSHIELTDKKGSSLDGKQFVASGHKDKGGWGFLKNIGNGGYEKAGLSPWGVSAKSNNAKLIIKKVYEVGEGKTTTPSGFTVSTESGYAEMGLTFGLCIKSLFIDTCTSSFIDLPLEFIPKEIIDTKISTGEKVLIATTSPPPKIPKSLLRRYRQQYGLPGEEYCEVPASNPSQTGPKTYEDAKSSDLVKVGDYQGRPEYLHKDLAPIWEKMQTDAAKEGVNLIIISGTRTKTQQQSIIDYKRNELKHTDEQIFRVNTKPGESEHHTGYVIDIGDGNVPRADLNNTFRNTKAGEWLAKNAKRYGFEKSYPLEDNNGIQREEWHWRYIGSEKARQALRLSSGASDNSHGKSATTTGPNAFGSAKDRANLLMTSILESSGVQNQTDVAVSIMNRVVSGHHPNNATDVVFASDQYQPNFGSSPVSNKSQAISRLARYKFGGSVQRAKAEYEALEGALSNPQNIIKAQNHIGGATDFRGFDKTTKYKPGDPYRGNPNRPNGAANFFIGESRSTLIATRTLEHLGIGSDKFTGISDAYYGGAGCISSAGISGPFTQGDGIATGSLLNPLPGSLLTSPYGWRIRPRTNQWKLHKGVDLSTGVRGTPILAADGGTVVYVKSGCVEGNVECGNQFGNRVEIDHGNGVITAYNHLHNVNVKEGQKVSRGQTIGGEGSTGWSTGPHLDLQVFQGNIGNHVNPSKYFRF